ncbi:dihem cytochrome c [mine drainage metagenome]|uniref:Dihem cytochrome c n=1 Tax=mine drainage metagenome TaxID=410659 RepID=A0A1J5QIE2_9ZZZZ
MTLSKHIFLILVAASAIQSQAAPARHKGENRGRPLMPAHVNAKWQQECSSCHIAYPPGLLPGASWKKIMSGLDQHFGANASLGQPETEEITAFLVKNGSNHWTAKTAPLRITQSGWYKSIHSELSAAVWKRASVKSHSNCSACHATAAKGIFSERGVKIPR